MIGCLRTRERNQPIIALYFESENVLKLYNLEAWSAHVETQIRVYQKTSRGCGNVKITLNLYHTTNRVMVDGKNTDLFLKDHELTVKSILRKEEVELLDR